MKCTSEQPNLSVITRGLGLAAAAIIHLVKANKASNHVHFPGDDVSSLSSFQSSSTLVFATASDDPDMITATHAGGDNTKPTE